MASLRRIISRAPWPSAVPAPASAAAVSALAVNRRLASSLFPAAAASTILAVRFPPSPVQQQRHHALIPSARLDRHRFFSTSSPSAGASLPPALPPPEAVEGWIRKILDVKDQSTPGKFREIVSKMTLLETVSVSLLLNARGLHTLVIPFAAEVIALATAVPDPAANPFLAVLHMARAEAQERLGDLTESHASLDAALELHPSNDLFKLKYQLLQKQWPGWSAVTVFLERWTSQFPNNDLPWYLLALARRQESKYEAAFQAITEALKLNPKFHHAFIVKGMVLDCLRRPEEAIEAFDAALRHLPKDDPSRADAFYNKGLTLMNLNRIEASLEAYKEALLVAPNYAQAHCNIGHILQGQKKDTEALEAFENALKANPKLIEALTGKAASLDDLGNPSEALRVYDQAIQLAPTRTVGWNGKGVCFSRQNRHKEALECYEQAVKLSPSDGALLLNKAACLYDLGKFEEALKDADGLLSLPNLPFQKRVRAVNLKASALKQLKRDEEAEDELKKVEQANLGDNLLDVLNQFTAAGEEGESSLPLELRANVMLGRQEFSETLELLHTGLQKFPEAQELHRLKGIALLMLDRHEEAVGVLQGYLAKNPKDLNTRLGRMSGLAALGRHEEIVADMTHEIGEITDEAAVAPCHRTRATAHQALGNLKEAIKDYEVLLRLAPEEGDDLNARIAELRKKIQLRGEK